MPEKRELISVRECARKLGVSDTAVHKAIAAGRIMVAGRRPGSGWPLLDFEDVRRRWAENTDFAQQRHANGVKEDGSIVRAPRSGDKRPKAAAAPAPEPAPAPPPQPPQQPQQPDEQRGLPSYNQSRAVREAYAARLARLEYEEKAGKLVSVDAVRVQAFKAHRMVRDAIMNLPDRLSHQLAACNDPVEIHRLMVVEVTEVLRGLSRDLYAK